MTYKFSRVFWLPRQLFVCSFASSLYSGISSGVLRAAQLCKHGDYCVVTSQWLQMG